VTVLLLAGLATAAYQGAFFGGVARTGVAVGTVVALGSGPVFTGLAGRWVEGRAPPRLWYGSTALAVVGGALIASGSGTAEADVVGLAAALGAGAAYATYTLASKRLLDGGLGPNEVAAGAFTIGALVSLPLLAVRPVAWLGTGRGLAVALFLGIFPTALAYLLFGRGLQILSGAVVTTLTLAEPATAVVLGALVLGERPGRAALLGMTVVLAGIAVLALPGVRDREKLRGPTGRGRRRGCR
jgi:DME family drug/metabolite transporter